MITRRVLGFQQRVVSPRSGLSLSLALSTTLTNSNHARTLQNFNDNPENSISRRTFRTSTKQEILPLLAVGTVALIGRYSWKALNRMDTEWEDYQWALQEYERQHRKDQDAAEAPLTIGVDLGTIYLKLSAMKVGDRADLVPTAQGDRYRFTGLMMTNDNTAQSTTTTMDNNVIVGRPALEKFYYTPEFSESQSPVKIPYRELQKTSQDNATDMVQHVVLPTVGEALERMSSNTITANNTPKNGNIQNNVRTVLTIPPVFYNQHKERIFHQNYHDDSHHTVTVPDPVAAIWGAQSVQLLPTPASKEEVATTSTLVIDFGGLASSISLVRQGKVIGTSCLDNIGGETYIQQLSERILQEAEDDKSGAGGSSSLSLRNDPMSLGLIQAGARASVFELVKKTAADVHIPYLFMGRRPDSPHLEMTISRAVLDQMVQDHWSQAVVPTLIEEGELSTSLPPPNNLSSLVTSAITKVLEESGEIPTNIQNVLLVGGGSKFKLFEQAAEEGIVALMGPSAAHTNLLVKPESALRAELTTMGAAALLPNYDYDYDNGLQRI